MRKPKKRTRTCIFSLVLAFIFIVMTTVFVIQAPELSPAQSEKNDAYGFFATLPDDLGRDALAVLYTSPIVDKTHPGNASDATSLQNMRDAIPHMKRCNELRVNEGLPPLKVNYTLVAISMSLSNWSVDNIEHARVFNVGENLAWGRRDDPFDAWYYREKHDLEANNSGETGHYLNIVNPEYEYTGFAITLGGQYGMVYEQSFAKGWYGAGEILRNTQSGKSIILTDATERGSVSVNEYEKMLDAYARGELDSATESSEQMHRLYNPNSGEHFYTASEYERNTLASFGWRYEGVGWDAPTSSRTPVYRLYNPNAGDHHYTTSLHERNVLVSVGWRDEGIGWYSDDAKTVPLYREYNPNAVSGAHNYTTSAHEHSVLTSIGWNDEGIGWYGT